MACSARQLVASIDRSHKVDGSNPAICGHRKSGHFGASRDGTWFYFKGSCTRKDV